MSADFRTEHFKGFWHQARVPGQRDWIQVVYKNGGEDPFGSVSLEEIGELAQLAGQAWPADPVVEVSYVILMRRPYDGTGSNPHPWAVMWTALADEDMTGGVSEDFARVTLDGFTSSSMETRLVRRTTVTADEVLRPLAPDPMLTADDV